MEAPIKIIETVQARTVGMLYGIPAVFLVYIGAFC